MDGASRMPSAGVTPTAIAALKDAAERGVWRNPLRWRGWRRRAAAALRISSKRASVWRKLWWVRSRSSGVTEMRPA